MARIKRRDPLELFQPLLLGQNQLVLQLLAGSDVALVNHVGPGGLTTLHAAVAVGCSAAVLAALCAAGAPLEAELNLGAVCGQHFEDLSQFLDEDCECPADVDEMLREGDGGTALDLAVRCEPRPACLPAAAARFTALRASTCLPAAPASRVCTPACKPPRACKPLQMRPPPQSPAVCGGRATPCCPCVQVWHCRSRAAAARAGCCRRHHHLRHASTRRVQC